MTKIGELLKVTAATISYDLEGQEKQRNGLTNAFGRAMMRRQDAILGFGILLACGATVAAAMGVMALLGYTLGVITTLVSAVIVNTSFE
jgi:hypothetical protein